MLADKCVPGIHFVTPDLDNVTGEPAYKPLLSVDAPTGYMDNDVGEPCHVRIACGKRIYGFNDVTDHRGSEPTRDAALPVIKDEVGSPPRAYRRFAALKPSTMVAHEKLVHPSRRGMEVARYLREPPFVVVVDLSQRPESS